MKLRLGIRRGLALLAAFPTLIVAQPQTVNGVVAIVNDKIITMKDVLREMAPELQFIELKYAGRAAEREKQFDKLQRETVQMLIENELILNEYKTAGYSLPETFIENEINKDIRTYGDRLELTKTLQAKGITFEKYREQKREDIILREMRRHNVPLDPLISPHKIEGFYKNNLDKYKLDDQVKLQMIVLPIKGDYPEYSAKKLAEEILKKTREGAHFTEMAAVYSQGSQKGEGGAWFERSELRKDLGDVAFGLKSGEVSSVIEAADACYLLFAEEKRTAHVRPLAEVRDEIETTLKDQEKKLAQERWIKKLMKKSFVQYF